jgi:hypothetical protein
VLLKCEPDVTRQILGMFAKYRTAEPEALVLLLSRKRMSQHFYTGERTLRRLGFDVRFPKPLIRDRKRGKPSIEKSEFVHITRRYNRDLLYEQVWSRPMQTVAKEYGVSDVYLARMCRALFIPLPGRGYWAKKAASKRVPPTPKLPILEVIEPEPRSLSRP